MVKAKKVAAAPKAGGGGKKDSKKDWKALHPHLFEKDPMDFGIGRDIQPKRDMSRFVKWPRYIRIQRQRAILKKRLKVPPAIHQFSKTLDKNQATNLFKLLSHYRPESLQEKKNRLLESAKEEIKEQDKKDIGKDKDKDKSSESKKGGKPLFLKYGLNHITSLIEKNKAKLVVIAHDVDPIELVVCLPALCRKKNIPYCIVKGKARLGHLVHKKTASVIALTEVRKDEVNKLEQIISTIRPLYNDNVTDSKKWGGGIMGIKAQAVIRKREKILAREATKAIKSA